MQQNINDNIRENNSETVETLADESKGSEEETGSLLNIEVSDKNAVIAYAGVDFVKSVFAVGNTMLYVCGIKTGGDYFFGCMQREENEFREFTIEMDEGMRAFNMVVDEQGRCHILWMSVEKVETGDQIVDCITYEKSCITIVDSQGILQKEIDVSDLFLYGYTRPFCFIVDREGNYYFEYKKEVVQIRNDGTQGSVFSCDGWIEGIGMGKSGNIYCTYQSENGERRLGLLDKNMISPCEIQLPQSDAVYAGVYAGTDTELLIFNKESGILAGDASHMEIRVSDSVLPIKGPEIAGYGILSDGRICLMEQGNKSTVFYYVPAGK